MRVVTLAVCLLGWCLGRPPLELATLLAACSAPVPTLGVLAVLAFRGARSRAAGRPADAMLLVRISSELRAGAGIREAIAGAASGDVRLAAAARLAGAGRPMEEVAAELAAVLRRFGPEVAAALRLSTSAGGSPAPALEELAGQVLALDDLARERRAAMAPGILQAGLLIGTVGFGGLWMAASGRLTATLAAGGIPAGLAVAGMAAVAVGTGVVVKMVRG